MQQEKITRYHWLLFVLCFLGVVFAGLVSTLMSVYLPIAVRDLLGDKNQGQVNTISAYINAVFIFGGAFGGFIAGIACDKAGRKKSVTGSIAVYSIFTLLTGYMPYWGGVVLCRFFTGFGMGAVLVTTTTLMMEEWPEKTRSIFMGILSIAIPVGIFSAGVIDVFVSAWRQAFSIGLVPVFIALLTSRLLRESVKWQGRRTAETSSAQKNQGVFFAEYRADLFFGSVIFGTMLIGLWAIFSWLPTWVESLPTTGNTQKERGICMMMLGAGGLAGGFSSGWLTNAAGARRSMLLCFTVCSVCAFVLFKTNAFFSGLIYPEVLVLALFFGASQGVLSVYIPLLFPVAIRGTATGFCFNIGRLFTASAVLFVGVLVTELGGYGNALFVFSMVFPLGGLFTFFAKDKVAD